MDKAINVTLIRVIYAITSDQRNAQFRASLQLYVIHREYATGKGYADLVMIPRRNVDKPALVIELKFNNSADTAIDQIKRKQYPAKIAEYTGDILLVGINYDKETKLHTCKIERTVITENKKYKIVEYGILLNRLNYPRNLSTSSFGDLLYFCT